MENFKWEVDQKEREIQFLKQQLDLMEQQGRKELEGLQQLLQNVKFELEMVQEDLFMIQKDKFMFQVKVLELKNNMKILFQQNQQFKLDLCCGVVKMRKELKGEVSFFNFVMFIKILDCLVFVLLLEELLRLLFVVSKEFFKNLNSCFQQFKQEMDSLQCQMEEYVLMVYEFLFLWMLLELVIVSFVFLGGYVGLCGDLQRYSQSRVFKEGLGE